MPHSYEKQLSMLTTLKEEWPKWFTASGTALHVTTYKGHAEL